MEDAIRSRVAMVGSTRIVCRSGSPTDISDLTIVRPHEARSMLSEIYNWFTEGFDTKDLQEAKALLEVLT